MKEMNIVAFSNWLNATATYLEANGWVQVKDKWRVPAQFGIHANDIHLISVAMKMQYQFDSDNLREG